MSGYLRVVFVLLFCFFGILFVEAQEKAMVFGKIKDDTNKPLELANIKIVGTADGAVTDKKGSFVLYVPSNQELVLQITYLGFKPQEHTVVLKAGEKKELNCKLELQVSILPDFEIVEQYIGEGNLIKINPKAASYIPSLGGGIESLIKTMPGVTSNNELSSQYNVRGGNFDENLVYVNDVLIYRPFLIRSGEQEGLSFINSDLVSSIAFSAGGFDAKYDDKMSSVLDIRYKTPTKFGGSAGISLLGSSAHLEGCSDNYRFKYLLGWRRKTNQYLLNSLETQGDYRPTFNDIQLFTSFDITENIDVSFLGNYSNNKYLVVPETRETNFGTLSQAYKLTVYFDGQEVDAFETATGAIVTSIRPNKNLQLKFIGSMFRSIESETYDIMGQYWLDELENDLGSDELGKKSLNKGIGTYLNHARNYLVADIYSAEHKGTRSKQDGLWLWGAKYNYEKIDDEIREWKMIDSAGYSMPHIQDSIAYIDPASQAYQYLYINDNVSASNTLRSNRLSSFVQYKHTFKYDRLNLILTNGVRLSYWDVNEDWIFSPRSSVIIEPLWERKFVFRFSAGLYQQPPFYRELRNFDASLNTDIKAQKSWHFVFGSDYNFNMGKRPFRYTAEVYYKHLENLVPYEVDNVRIKYYAKNMAHGYAAGIDMKLNGEFVPDAESWASVSLLFTQEDIEGDYYYKYYNAAGELITSQSQDKIKTDSLIVHPGYIPRPTDSRFNFSLFFQDYLPRNPSYKVHLSFIYGSGLPFGPPTYERYKDTLRMPAYFRVDVGFSKLLYSQVTAKKKRNFTKHFKDIWLSAEVFNLLQNYNTISYLWIKDIENRQWAIPNYLTTRRLNVKLMLRF